jgi:hypothetical protein
MLDIAFPQLQPSVLNIEIGIRLFIDTPKISGLGL